MKLLEFKRAAQIDDEMLVLADVAQKARVQVAMFVAELVLKHLPKDRAAALPTTLSEAAGLTISRSRWKPHASWTARIPGDAVADYELMELYPQAGAGSPSVMYVRLRRGTDGAGRQPATSQPAPTSK